MKKLINKQSVKGILIITLNWIVIMGVFSVLFYQNIYKFAMISQRIFRI